MFPNTVPRPMIRAPRSDVIGGWFGGNPTERGSAAMFGIRMGWGSRVRAPSRPWPTGGFPRAARSSGVIPTVMKSWIDRPSGVSTPSAP